MREFMGITKALADANRVRILMFLRHGDLCLCQIIELLSLAPSTVSKHMAILYQAGLVESRKEGRWMYYYLTQELSPVVQASRQWMETVLVGEEQIRTDDQRLKGVRKVPKETCCTHYKKGN